MLILIKSVDEFHCLFDYSRIGNNYECVRNALTKSVQFIVYFFVCAYTHMHHIMYRYVYCVLLYVSTVHVIHSCTFHIYLPCIVEYATWTT